MRVVGVIQATAAVAVVATLLLAAVNSDSLLMQVTLYSSKRQFYSCEWQLYSRQWELYTGKQRLDVWKWQLRLAGRDLKQQWGWSTSIVVQNGI